MLVLTKQKKYRTWRRRVLRKFFLNDILNSISKADGVFCYGHLFDVVPYVRDCVTHFNGIPFLSFNCSANWLANI